MVYDINSNFVNISILKNNYTIKYDAYSVVANKAVPQAVNIKFVWYCNIMDVNLFIEATYILPQSTNLFRDLLNFENLKKRYELK